MSLYIRIDKIYLLKIHSKKIRRIVDMKKRIYMAKEIRACYEENMNKFCDEAVKNGWQVQNFASNGNGTILVLFYKEVE